MVSRLKGEKSEGGCEASFLAGETSGLTNPYPSQLGALAEKKVEAERSEDEVGPPRGQERAQETHVAQAPENSQRSPIEHGDDDAQPKAAAGAALPHGKGKGNGQERHDQGDKGERDFRDQVDLEARR